MGNQNNKVYCCPFTSYSHLNKNWINHVKEIIYFSEVLKKLGYEYNEKYLKILAVFHDIGKLYKEWQNYLRTKSNRIDHSGLSSYIFYSYASNNIICEELNDIIDCLQKYFKIDLNLSSQEINVLTYLILVHHSSLKSITRSGPKTSYDLFFKGLLKKVKESQNWTNYINIITQRIKLNKEEAIEYLNTFAVFKISDRLSGSFKRNLKKEEIYPILYSFGITDLDFDLTYENFKKLLEKINRNKNIDENRLNKEWEIITNKVNILLAPTGFGKTTLSIFKGIYNNRRFLITLPTITAIEQFSNRLKTIVNEIGYFSKIVGKYFYFYNPFTENEEELALNEYFISRSLLKPIMITTVDQLILTFLQTKEYFIKRFALQNRFLIIDEIHLLNPQILFLLLYFLKEYKNLFKDFLFMSATFPKFLQDLISEELDIDTNTQKILLYDFYPKKRIWIDFLPNNEYDTIFNKINEIYKKEKDVKIIVLFNTVVKAQDFFEFIKNKIKNVKVEIFHSKFTYRDRKRKEKIIINSKGPFILIATQVVEVSLDIDYDYMLTEVAPLPDLIQRFGRINRRNRYKPKEPNIYIFDYFSESKYVYSEKLLEETKKILNKYLCSCINEQELIKELDYSNYKVIFKREYYEVKNNYENRIQQWLEEISHYFYYLFFGNEEDVMEELKNILNFRDSINMLVSVSKEDLKENDKKLYEKYFKLLEKSKSEKNFEKFFKAKLGLREFFVSVPFYYVQQIISVESTNKNYNYKIPILPSGIYSSEIGLNIKKIKEIIKEGGFYEPIIM